MLGHVHISHVVLSWPPPQFRADSENGFAAWIIAREPQAHVPIVTAAIERIVEKHYDSLALLINPAR
jgi:hypothetical protein